MRPTNYCSEIAEQFMKISDYARNRDPVLWRNWLSSVNNIQNSVKFRLPDDGITLGLRAEELSELVSGHHSLPYDLVSLEYYRPECGDRVVICCRQSDAHEIEICTFFKGAKSEDTWMPSGSVAKFNFETGKMVIECLSDSEAALLDFENTKDVALKEARNDLCVVADFVAAMSCRNVTPADQLPSKALNKKREKSGKIPFFTYKVLEVEPGSSNQKAESGGGTHASPRVHLRRGHIRRLPKGNIWVNHTVVGNKNRGMVHKDYAVKGVA